MAAVIWSISRIPGPPLGPSVLMTTTWPDLIWPLKRASSAPCSPSNTRAGPSKTSRSMPATLTTAPPGARLPRKTAIPPSDANGSDTGRITS